MLCYNDLSSVLEECVRFDFGGAVLRLVLNILFVIICVALVVLVLMQEGKSQGLAALSGGSDSYWGKNKGRSIEGRLSKITTVVCILFVVIALILNLSFI